MTINHIHTSREDARHIIRLIVCIAAYGGCIKTGGTR